MVRSGRAVSQRNVRLSGYAFCVLGLTLSAAGGLIFGGIVGGSGIAVAIVAALLGGVPVGWGIACILQSEIMADSLLAKAAGLSREDQSRALVSDLDTIIPGRHRAKNPEVAKATVRVVVRAHRERVKTFTRIANTLLTPTDAAQLFGPHLDDFVMVLGQSVERPGDQTVDELLDFVRSRAVSPEIVTAYLGRLKSVSVAVRAHRDGIPLDYAAVLS